MIARSSVAQLEVLTNSDVQKGNNTHIINKLLYFMGSVANKCEIGYASKKQNTVTQNATFIVLNQRIL